LLIKGEKKTAVHVGFVLAKGHCDRVFCDYFGFRLLLYHSSGASCTSFYLSRTLYTILRSWQLVKIRHLKISRWEVTAQIRYTFSALKLFVAYSQHATGSAKKGSGHSLLISLFERVYDIPLCLGRFYCV